MMRRPRTFTPGLVALILLTALLSPTDASAYLDPGTGSLVIQVVVGSILAVGYTVKVYWRSLIKFFRKNPD